MRGLGLAIALLLTGCPPPVHNPDYDSMPYQPIVETKPGADKASLYKATLQAIGENGLQIESQDATAGIVNTQWLYDRPQYPRFAARYQIQCEDGELTVMVHCRTEEGTCPPDVRPRMAIDAGKRLAAQIIASAKVKEEPPPAAPPTPAEPSPAEPASPE